MEIERTNLKENITRVQLSFDTQLAELLVARPELSHAYIQKEFGVSQKVIRRVVKQFNIAARKRGPKPSEQMRGV
ncbi:MAG: hypothetical protein WBQ85_13545 [Candidatus Sulfotelmatobacter sp.]